MWVVTCLSESTWVVIVCLLGADTGHAPAAAAPGSAVAAAYGRHHADGGGHANIYEYDNASGGDAGHITNAYTFDITNTTRTGSRIVDLRHGCVWQQQPQRPQRRARKGAGRAGARGA